MDWGTSHRSWTTLYGGFTTSQRKSTWFLNPCVQYAYLTSASSISNQRFPLIKTPKRPYLRAPDSNREILDVWYPYPTQSYAVPSHTVHLVNASSDLSRIAHDVSTIFFDPQSGLKNMSFLETLQNVQIFHARLQDWDKELIACLREESSGAPHVLALQ